MNLSQAEIDALLSGTGAAPQPEPEPEMQFLGGYNKDLGNGNGTLSAVEIDTLGEVGNMCMGAVATTMYTLLDRKVEITTPRVSVHRPEELLEHETPPYVAVGVEYTEGLLGKNLLLMKEVDAALITDVLMGGEGVVEQPVELNELHMSAMNEIMNQMIAASATALSQLLMMPVNISTPISTLVSNKEDVGHTLEYDNLIIETSFRMYIEGLLDSVLIQIMPYEQGRQINSLLIELHHKAKGATPYKREPIYATPNDKPYTPEPEPQEPIFAPTAGQGYTPDFSLPDGPPAEPPAPEPEPAPKAPTVNVRPMSFESFDEELPQELDTQGSMDLIYDIPLEVSAELGTTVRLLSDVLAFEPGTVLMLDKAAGDPVEVKINGKKIARGEVVIIEENYGVRITDLPSK